MTDTATKHKLVYKITFKSGRQMCPIEVYADEESALKQKDEIFDLFIEAAREHNALKVPIGADRYLLRADEIAAFGVGVYPFKEANND